MAYVKVYNVSDGTLAGTDIVVGIIAGLAGFATLFGLGLGIGYLIKTAREIKV